MELHCASCQMTFEKPGVRPGDALMCPRCRSLVEVPFPTPIPAAVAVPSPVRVTEPVPAQPPVAHLLAAGEPAAGRAGAGAPAPPSHIALRRQCPWCRRRYDAEARACPACGRSAARAQLDLATLQEREANQSRHRLLGRNSPAAYASGVLGGLAYAVVKHGSPTAWLVLAVVVLAGGWVGWRMIVKARAARAARAGRARRADRAD